MSRHFTGAYDRLYKHAYQRKLSWVFLSVLSVHEPGQHDQWDGGNGESPSEIGSVAIREFWTRVAYQTKNSTICREWRIQNSIDTRRDLKMVRTFGLYFQKKVAKFNSGIQLNIIWYMYRAKTFRGTPPPNFTENPSPRSVMLSGILILAKWYRKI